MTVSHSTGPGTPAIIPRVFPALKILERQTPPLKYGRTPYWRAPVAEITDDIYVPRWNWVSPMDFPEGESVTVLGVNAGCLSVLGSDLQIGHSHLVHTGPFPHLPALRAVAPGYYRITIPYWAFEGTIVHPLGDSTRVQTEPALWVPAPTLVLLLELADAGHLGWFEILDSWTAEVVTDFHSWADRLHSYRGEYLDRVEMAQTEMRRQESLAVYQAFQCGCAEALDAMLTGQGCLVHRPDWAHTVYAQQAATMWRMAWRFTFTGHSLVAAETDEMSMMSQDLGDVIMRAKPPFRYDATGRKPGALRPVRVTFINCEPPPRAIGTDDEQHGEAP